jgi:WD repeat-containing protein 35
MCSLSCFIGSSIDIKTHTHRLWGKELDIGLAAVQWSPEGNHLLFATTEGEVHLYDSVGEFAVVVNVYAVNTNAGVDIIGLRWYNGSRGYLDTNVPCLAIGFANGCVQIGRNDADDNPMLIDTALDAVKIAWNANGTVLAVAGSQRIATTR